MGLFLILKICMKIIRQSIGRRMSSSRPSDKKQWRQKKHIDTSDTRKNPKNGHELIYSNLYYSIIFIFSDLQTLHNNFHIAPLYRYNIPKVMDLFLKHKKKADVTIKMSNTRQTSSPSGLPVVICSNILRCSSTRGSDQQIQSLIRQRRLRISLSDSWA